MGATHSDARLPVLAARQCRVSVAYWTGLVVPRWNINVRYGQHFVAFCRGVACGLGT